MRQGAWLKSSAFDKNGGVPSANSGRFRDHEDFRTCADFALRAPTGTARATGSLDATTPWAEVRLARGAITSSNKAAATSPARRRPNSSPGGRVRGGACKVTSRSRPRRSSPVILQPVVRRHSLLRNRELEHALGVFVVCTMSDPTIRTANTEDQALRTPAQRPPCELYPGHCAVPPWRADALVTGVPPTGSRSKGPMRLPLTSPTDRRCLVGPW
jgi:hypothetical protein